MPSGPAALRTWDERDRDPGPGKPGMDAPLLHGVDGPGGNEGLGGDDRHVLALSSQQLGQHASM